MTNKKFALLTLQLLIVTVFTTTAHSAPVTLVDTGATFITPQDPLDIFGAGVLGVSPNSTPSGSSAPVSDSPFGNQGAISLIPVVNTGDPTNNNNPNPDSPFNNQAAITLVPIDGSGDPIPPDPFPLTGIPGMTLPGTNIPIPPQDPGLPGQVIPMLPPIGNEVPEPATFILIGVSILGGLSLQKKRSSARRAIHYQQVNL